MIADGKKRLSKNFTAHSLEAWQEEVKRLLKGAPFEKRMLSRTYEGITLKSLYTNADLDGLTQVNSIPGAAPYLRGTETLGYRGTPWRVAQELPYPSPAEFNAAVSDDLTRGLDVVNLVFDQMGRVGLDADDSEHLAARRAKRSEATVLADRSGLPQVGRDGTSISTLADMRAALAGIDLSSRPVVLQPGAAALPALVMLVATAREAGIEPSRLQGALLSDPLANLLNAPSWQPGSLRAVYDDLYRLTAWAQSQSADYRTLAACGFVYHEAGGSAVEELAFTMASAVATLREMGRRELPVETAAPRMTFGFSVGTQFFMEIAKLRAARLLWHRIVAACGVDEDLGKTKIYARGSRYDKTAFDPHVNILRATTESLAAVLGGCDMIETCPFDEPFGPPKQSARRLSRNTQLILREECHFDCLIDPAGGCWSVEALTDQLAEKAWTLFQQVEAFGGLADAVRSGFVHYRIGEIAVAREAGIAARRDVLVGTNKYPNPQEGLPPDRNQDLTGSATALIESCRNHKSSAEGRVVVLEQLRNLANQTPPPSSTELREWMNRRCAAAEAGVTVGDFCSLAPNDEEELIPDLPPRRGGAGFEALRREVNGDCQPFARQAHIFLANIGAVGRYMPRLDFTRSFYEVGGFNVVGEVGFDSPVAAAEQAGESGAPVVVIVGTDATYAEVVNDLVPRLKALPSTPWIVLAGHPGERSDEYTAAGIDEFIHARSDALESLRRIASRCGIGQTAE